MKKFKLNSNKKVLLANRSTIFPGVGQDGVIIRSVNFSKEAETKIATLRRKYKISRSAIIRILLEEAE